MPLGCLTMQRFLFKWCISAIALAVASWLVEGIIVTSGWALFGAALVIGFLNAFLRPIIILLTLPINILTLGLFTFVINGTMIMFASVIVRGFTVTSFWAALAGAIIMSAISFVLNLFISG